MKRICSGCRAFDWTSKYVCGLGYPVLTEGKWPMLDFRPLEQCEKPTTIRNYIKLLHERESTE